MGQSLSKVYVHIIFSTKNRQSLIDEFIKNSLFDYIGGICKRLNCNPVKVGGYKDHVHVLCLLSKHIAQTKLLEEIKRSSSKWIKGKEKKYSNFYWQDGYAIYSVKHTDLDLVSKYIEDQGEHHSKRSFKDELRMLLKKYDIEFDERYIWD